MQDPANDDAAFKKFRETNGNELVSIIRKWEFGCKEMESRINLMLARIRKESLQEDGGSFSFWHKTNFQKITTLPFQNDESSMPKPKIPENQRPSTSRLAKAFVVLFYNMRFRQQEPNTAAVTPGKDSGTVA